MWCEDCPHYKDKSLFVEIHVDENKKLTNFDKITESAENLVEFFEINGLSCDNNAAKNRKCHRQGCTVCLKEWLQQEAE